MRVGIVSNNNLVSQKKMPFRQSSPILDKQASDRFVSTIAFTANPKAVKLPIKEIDKLWKTSISDMRKTSSIAEKEKLFDSTKNKFYEEQKDFFNKNKTPLNESTCEELAHDTANVIMETFAKVIHYKSYKNFEEEVASCHKRIIDIYTDYQVVMTDPNFSKKNYKQIFDFVMKKTQKLSDKKNINVLISDNGLDSIQKDKLLIHEHNLYFVFNNILGNAIKYTPVGGKIDISFSPVVKDGKKYLAFVTKDSGIGIKKEEIEAAKNGIRATNAVESGIYGTGHGLKKVNKILKKVLGELNIESNGSGSGLKVECLIRDSDDYYSNFK